MAKLILGPLIGGLSHNSVNFWGRADSPSTLHAWLATRKDSSDASPAGRTKLMEDNAFAGIVSIKKLKPETTYYFALRLDNRRPPGKDFKPFKTFPRPGQVRSFRFAFGSCFRPDGENSGEAFRHILANQKDIPFVLMLGDQIYADEWRYNGLGKVAVTLDEYRRIYLNTWSDPDLRALLGRVPVFMTLDDHEVDNDWHWEDKRRAHALVPWYTRFLRWIGGRPLPERRIPRRRVRHALQAYWEHQGMHAPKLLLPMERERAGGEFNLMEGDAGSLAYTFYYGAAAFFVMDTRTMRIHNRDTRVILGQAQWKVLQEWLLDVKDAYPVKFLVTSSALLFEMFGDFADDRWSGFRAERDRLLFFLAGHGIENVYFLAGDLHEAHAISAEVSGPDGRPIPIWEFCATPFKQDPAWFAKLLMVKPSSAAIQNSHIHFSISRINYGMVDVQFDKGGTPHVTYSVHYKDGDWKTASVSADTD
jgi:alkaline phosphatase D